MYLDLHFNLTTTSAIPADHGYLLYSALSRILPAIHSENGVGVLPITGRQIGDRLLMLMPWSDLGLRTRENHISQVIPLAGKRINLAGRTLGIGVPTVHALEPRTALRSRLVTIKGFMDPEEFKAATRRQLDALEVSPEVTLTLGKRRTLRIKDKEVVGHEVLLEGLSAQESIAVQESGLGGRRHMGCGVFVPYGVTS